MDKPPRVVALSELPAIEVAGVRWHPVQKELGVTAYGINAYSGDAGEHVVEPHDETGSGTGGHEELYVVVAGAATFTLDGEAQDVAAPAFVFVPAPTTRREAVATQDGTIVLALGGEPGAFGPLSPWQFYFGAVPLAEQGRHAEAAAFIAEGLEHHPGNERILYDLACQQALAGDLDAARDSLRRAVATDPKLADWAREDDDLAAVRDVLDAQ